MSNFMMEATLDWQRKFDDLENGLRNLDEELKEDASKKEKERKESMTEFFSPEVMEKRSQELTKLSVTLKKLSDKATSIQVDLRMPIVPGVHLYVQPENQKAVADFCPHAYEIITKTSSVADGLKSLTSDSLKTLEKMNKDVHTITNANRQMISKVQKLQKERNDLNVALGNHSMNDKGID